MGFSDLALQLGLSEEQASVVLGVLCAVLVVVLLMCALKPMSKRRYEQFVDEDDRRLHRQKTSPEKLLRGATAQREAEAARAAAEKRAQEVEESLGLREPTEAELRALEAVRTEMQELAAEQARMQRQNVLMRQDMVEEELKETRRQAMKRIRDLNAAKKRQQELLDAQVASGIGRHGHVKDMLPEFPHITAEAVAAPATPRHPSPAIDVPKGIAGANVWWLGHEKVARAPELRSPASLTESTSSTPKGRGPKSWLSKKPKP